MQWSQRLSAALLLAAMPCPGLAQGEQAQSSKPRWITLEEHDLMLQLPKDWDKTEQAGSVFAAKLSGASAPRVTMSMRVLPGVTKAIVNADGFAVQLHANIKKAVAAYAADGNGKMKLAGEPGVWLRGKTPVAYITQFVFAYRGKGFLVAFSHPIKGAKRHSESCNAVARSIRPISKTPAKKQDPGPKWVAVKGRVKSKQGFSIEAPKGWMLAKQPKDAVLKLASSKGASMNVKALGPLTIDRDPGAFAREISRDLRKAFGTSFRTLSSRKTKVAGREAIRMASIATQKDGKKMRFLQLVVSGKKQGFVVTFTIEDAAYKKQIKLVNAAIRSIRIE